MAPEKKAQRYSDIRNSKAARDYHLGERFEAGIVLTGTEVKSIRAGKAQLTAVKSALRAYQGAEGRVYPYALHDSLTGQKEDVDYTIVYLENEYVRIGIAPQLGGRIFSGLDKTNNYDFFYRQSVIKPALIGMIGAWISGGVEWNIPHHHRATSLLRRAFADGMPREMFIHTDPHLMPLRGHPRLEALMRPRG